MHLHSRILPAWLCPLQQRPSACLFSLDYFDVFPSCCAVWMQCFVRSFFGSPSVHHWLYSVREKTETLVSSSTIFEDTPCSLTEYLPDGKVAHCRRCLRCISIQSRIEDLYLVLSENTACQAINTASLDELAQTWKIEDIEAYSDYHNLEQVV